MVEEHGERLRAVAVVIEGSGFRAAIVRSVASGIVRLARPKSRTPVSYFATIDDGVGWLSESANLRGERAVRIARSVAALRNDLARVS
jgi:hypothetical protein